MNKKKGITLIALIITIIVMLILVAVTINMAVNGGLFGYAKRVNDEKLIADEKEQISIAYFNAKMEKLGDEIDDQDIQKALDSQLGANKTKATLTDEEKIKILFNDTKHIYIIDGQTIVKKDPLELHITNYTELYDFATRVNSGESFSDYIVYLDNDIEMETDNWICIGTPGGRVTPSYSFDGIFEGNNHKIKNLKITTSRTYNGLFCINFGTIQNLTVESEYTGAIGGYVGSIAGENIGTIENCNALVNYNCNCSSNTYGGITGTNSGTIKNCISRGEMQISGANNASIGGITGRNGKDILKCKNYANITAGGDASYYVGGITGYLGSGTVEQCLNSGNIIGSATYKGGITGLAYSYSYYCTIFSCVNKGNITNKYASDRASGICCRCQGNTTINNCYNTGTILSDNQSNNFAVGILLEDIGDNITIENCYNAGGVNLGGRPIIYSFDPEDYVKNCYFNKDIHAQNNPGQNIEFNATGLTTEEMRAPDFLTMLGNAFKADTNNINNGFPILSWE